MATFMEKDVLIELISYVVAVTARDIDSNNPDIIELLELKNKLYCMDPEEIDYQKVAQFIKDKQAKLEGIWNKIY